MSVARLSISLPQSIYQMFLSMVKRKETTKSQMVLHWIKEQRRKEKNEKLRAEFNAIANDPDYIRESQVWVAMANANYIKNILDADTD